MVELDELTRRALLAREGPPASARADILAGLRDRLGGSGGPDDGFEGGDSPSVVDPVVDPGVAAAAGGQAIWAAKVVGATLGLAAAGIVSLGLGGAAVREFSKPGSRFEAGAPAVVEVQTPAAVSSSSPVQPTSVTPAQPEPAPSPTAAPAPRVAAQPAASADTSTLAAELELVRAAKRLLVDDPEAALAQLQRHAEQFPNGVLAPERETLGVELRCKLGRAAEKCPTLGTDPPRAGD